MANSIWIVVHPREGQVPRQAWEAVAAGQKLAAALGVKAEAVVLGSGVGAAAEELGRHDLAAVHVADHEALKTYTPGGTIGALAPALKAQAPGYVVFPHNYQTVDFMARLAQESGSGLLPEVTAFTQDGDGLLWTRPVMTGKLQAKVRVKGEGTMLLSVQSGAFSADGRVAGSAPVAELGFDAAHVRPDREILGYEEVGGGTIDLTKAGIIVAVGRGVGGADKMGPVEELAKALGADIGASRPVIDNGWLPRDRQIGSSGQTVAPKLYVAAGISGAIQHLVGMKGASVVVAINKDPGAPIFAVADYGIVGDLHEILPALTEAVRAARG
jgi:electron transfer flavoprotein alpha subunit